MRIFRDIISGDEIASDTYPITLIHDAVYKIQLKMISESNDIDESAIGGNASAEEAAESTESSSTSGLDLVLCHKLVETGMAKKDFKTYIGSYMKAIKKKMAENESPRINEFQKGASAFTNELLKDYKNFQMFMGEHMDPDGALVYVRWDEVESDKVYAYIFKDGIEEEKV